jgi:hypothetical protein
MARGPKPIAIHLSEDERAELERIIRRRIAGQALVQRARIVLACAEAGATVPAPLRRASRSRVRRFCSFTDLSETSGAARDCS